jgi:hypothetical protein
MPTGTQLSIKEVKRRKSYKTVQKGKKNPPVAVFPQQPFPQPKEPCPFFLSHPGKTTFEKIERIDRPTRAPRQTSPRKKKTSDGKKAKKSTKNPIFLFYRSISPFRQTRQSPLLLTNIGRTKPIEESRLCPPPSFRKMRGKMRHAIRELIFSVRARRREHD